MKSKFPLVTVMFNKLSPSSPISGIAAMFIVMFRASMIPLKVY